MLINKTKDLRKRFLRPQSHFQFARYFFSVNWLYVILICLLAIVGYVTLYSAGGGSSTLFAKPQAIRFGVAFVFMLGLTFVPLNSLRKSSWYLYLFSIFLLIAVVHSGHIGKGAERWIVIGGMQIQPSEFAKITLIMLLADWFSQTSNEKMGNILWLIPPAIMVIIPVFLVLKEPNLGTAFIIGCVGASIFFASGMRLWQIILPAIPLPFLGRYIYLHLHDYQKDRIITFLHPENDPHGAGYNIIQSKIALGSGGMWGQGYLQGSQGQLNFLPEKQTDFIFTMLAEEWGFARSGLVILLLLLIILGGMFIALRCKNRFGSLLALGISVNFFLYCLVNLSMIMGAIPVGGVPLPLISYGGSALLAVMFGFGCLLNVWAHRNETL